MRSSASADSDTTRITALKEGDLDGLTNLWHLGFEGQGLRALPEGIFDDLGDLTDLSLSLNNFRTLGEGVFDNLESLEDLDLSGNLLVGLPEDIFDELGALEKMGLLLNNLHGLPEGVFDGLESLEVLDLRVNNLTELPEGVFDELGELSALLLDYNRLAELPEDVFDGLGSLSVLWMDYNGLAELPEGVFDELGDLRELTLTGNDLTELSEGAFEGLGNLRSLLLDDNRLTELSEGAFEGLDDLQELELSHNQLDSLTQGAFDGLDGLEDLYLLYNGLTELPEDVFDELSDLEILVLSYNRLTTIPEGFLGDLDDLRGVTLRGNELLVLPPGLFAGVDDLETVWLDENPGAPFPFYLELIRTDNTDPMAPAPATVEVRVAEGAPFEVEIGLVSRGGSLDDSEVAISAGDTASRSVTASAVASAAHSLAIDSIWDNRSWFEEDDYLGLEFAIGAPLVLANPDEVKVEVPAVYLTQGAQSLDGGVPLVAGRQALLRVFATAHADNDFDPRARATFYVGDATVYVDLTPPALIPRAVDESRMDGSFTGVVPATAMQPGVEMVVELDRTDVIPETDGSQLRIPATGRMALDVVALETFDLKIVPIAFGSDVTGRNDKVASLAEDLAGDDSRGALPPTRTLLPIAEMDVTARDRYVTWADTLQDGIVALPDELRLLRHAEAGGTDTCYHGIFAAPATRYPDYWDGVLGVGYIAGWSALSLSHDQAGQYRSELPLYHCPRTGPQPGSTACALRLAPRVLTHGIPILTESIGVWGYAFPADGVPGRSVESGRVPGPHVLLRAGGCQRLQLHDCVGTTGTRLRPRPLARRPAAAPGDPVAMGIHP